MLLVLVAALALGQQGAGPDNGGVSRGNFLRIPDYRTPGTAVQSYFVNASTGNDSFDCRSTTTPCLTIQGAVNKVPKLLRDQVTVNVAAGNYTGALITGFSVDNGIQQATGGFLLDGALATSTLATGSATGTAAGAGQSAGSGSTFGTLCDSGATWTVSDLVGRFITTASPTNTTRVVTANTATCVTIAGVWSLPVAGSTTYTLQDPSVIINAAVTGPATPIAAAQANRAGFIISGNDFSYSFSGLVLRNLRVANATGFGVTIAGVGGYRFEEFQFRTGSTTAQPLLFGGSLNTSSIGSVTSPTVQLANVDLSISSNLIGISYSFGLLNVTASLLRNSATTNTAIAGNAAGATNSLGIFNQTRIAGWANGIQIAPFSLSTGGGALAFTGNQISCGSAGIAFNLASASTGQTQLAQAAFGPIVNTAIDTCGTAVMAPAGTIADVTSLTGSVATTAFDVRNGGLVLFTKASTTITAGTNEIDLDSGGLTATFADVTAGSCVSTAPQVSRVCGR